MVAAFIFVLGAVFGSFVNALVWRIKKKKDWVKGRSMCTHCKHALAPIDLIPILSWVQLRGRCRYCRKKIDDSPLVELGLAAAFLVSFLAWPHGFDAIGVFRFVIWLAALVILAAMLVYDLRYMLLPDRLTVALAVLAVIQLLVLLFTGTLEENGLLLAATSVLVGGGIFHLLFTVSGGRSIGGGDVKLGYAYGLLLLNPILPWFVMLVASVVGSLVAAGLMIAGKAGMKSKLPFGPMLVMGVYVAMLWGLAVWEKIGLIWQ